MRILKRIAIGFAAFLVLFAAIALVLPSSYEVTRSVLVDASRARVHRLVSDLREWPKWQTWRDEDPTIEVRIGDLSSGVGASQSWTGDSGSGELFVTATSPEGGIEYDLSFDDGAWRAAASIHYEERGPLTEVTWRMSGRPDNLIGRYLALAVDGMVGPMFERSLQNLKRRAESRGVTGLESEVLDLSTDTEGTITERPER